MFDTESVDRCPLCHTEGEYVLSAPDPCYPDFDLHVYDCPNCGCTYHNPKMTREAMELYYRSGEYLSNANGDNFSERRRALTRILLAIHTNIGFPRRHLDVGCGHGYFLSRMKDWSRRVETVGYDLHRYPDAVHEVITDKSLITGEFDFISCIHVLEHMYDPLQALTWMESLLASPGILMLELPVKRKIMIEHPVTFSPDTVPVIMNHIGIKNYTTYSIQEFESCIVFGKK